MPESVEFIVDKIVEQDYQSPEPVKERKLFTRQCSAASTQSDLIDIEELENTIRTQMNQLERLQEELNEKVSQNENADIAIKNQIDQFVEYIKEEKHQ